MQMIVIAFLTASLACSVHGKVYERCELARELVNVHEVSMQQVATWVCIAEHESQYNTSAVGEKNGDNSKDHGLFQISDLYWCSPPGKGWACGVTCAELEDDNIEDDFICARRIYREHKLLSGNGFNAWAVYHTHCAGPVDSYIKGCFQEKFTKNTAGTSSGVSTSTEPVISSTTNGVSTQSTGLPKVEVERTFSAGKFDANKPWFQWFSRFKWS